MPTGWNASSACPGDPTHSCLCVTLRLVSRTGAADSLSQTVITGTFAWLSPPRHSAGAWLIPPLAKHTSSHPTFLSLLPASLDRSSGPLVCVGPPKGLESPRSIGLSSVLAAHSSFTQQTIVKHQTQNGTSLGSSSIAVRKIGHQHPRQTSLN